MKVLNENNFKDWSLNVECNGIGWRQDGKFPCNSTLELNVNDIFKRGWFKYPDSEGSNYGFICQICGCFTEIKEELLPNGVKRLAKQYLSRKGDQQC